MKVKINLAPGKDTINLIQQLVNADDPRSDTVELNITGKLDPPSWQIVNSSDEIELVSRDDFEANRFLKQPINRTLDNLK